MHIFSSPQCLLKVIVQGTGTLRLLILLFLLFVCYVVKRNVWVMFACSYFFVLIQKRK